MEINSRMDGRSEAGSPPWTKKPQRPAWPLEHTADQPRSHKRRPLGIALLLVVPLLVVATAVGALLAQAAPRANGAIRHRVPFAPLTSCTPQTTATVKVSGTRVAAAVTSSGAQAAMLATKLSASCATTGLVDFAVYNAKNVVVYQTWLSNVTLSSAAQTFQTLWQLPAQLPAGSYVLDLGVFTPNWQQELAWVNNGATFQVANGQVIASTSPNPTPTNTPAPNETPAPTTTPSATDTPNPTNTPAPTTTPSKTPTPSPTTPPTGGKVPTAPAGGALAPGTTLPSEAACAAAIPSSTWEPRPDNTTANHSVPTASQIAGLAPWDGSIGLDPRADALRLSITGNYTGTTDQILQWVACKWGIDPNIVRAQAVTESSWHQNAHGDLTSTTADCPSGAATSGSSCYQSYGILQIKWMYNKSAWPMSRNDTAFSAEYTYGMLRACYEGYMTWLGNGYKAGDIWGCLGYWYSGGWYTSDAQTYINSVKSHYNNQDWLKSGF